MSDKLPPLNYRSLSTIARDIRRNWANPYFGAVPYLGAMASLDQISDAYGADSGKSIVAYFLSNATMWRGPMAKAIKAELNAMLKGKPRPSPNLGAGFPGISKAALAGY